MKHLFLVFSVFFVLISCSRHVYDINSVSKYATNVFGKQFAIKMNKTETYAIIIHKEKVLTNLFADVHFIIYDVKANKDIMNGILKQGNISWVTTDEIMTISIEPSNDKDQLHEKKIFYYDINEIKKHNN